MGTCPHYYCTTYEKNSVRYYMQIPKTVKSAKEKRRHNPLSKIIVFIFMRLGCGRWGSARKSRYFWWRCSAASTSTTCRAGPTAYPTPSPSSLSQDGKQVVRQINRMYRTIEKGWVHRVRTYIEGNRENLVTIWRQLFWCTASVARSRAPPHLSFPTWTSIQSQRGDPQADQWMALYYLPPPCVHIIDLV